MNREVVLDTETTGLSRQRDRIIEIGAIEVIDGIETSRIYHQRIQPNMPVPADATRIHGIYDKDLVDCPTFGEIVYAFLEFIGDDPLVIHNGMGFDKPMLDAELARISMEPIQNRIIDTLVIAQGKYGRGARNSLDALADRFGIDRSFRTLHGALIDCQLLARVHGALIGRDDLLHGSVKADVVVDVAPDTSFMPENERQRWFAQRPGLVVPMDEAAAHAAFLEKIADPLWKTFLSESTV